MRIPCRRRRPSAPRCVSVASSATFKVSADGGTLTVVLVDQDGENGALEAWDARSRSRLTRLAVPHTPTAVHFSPDRQLVAVGYPNGLSHVSSTANWKPVTRLQVGDVGDIQRPCD